MAVSIIGLDKAVVLQALHSNSKAQGMGWMHFDEEGANVEECQAALDQSTYVDYLQGRVIKVDFAGDALDPWGYDRDNGEGSLEVVVNSLRSQSGVGRVLRVPDEAEEMRPALEDLEILISKYMRDK